MKKPIAVIDYGIGNVGSVVNMLKRAGARAVPAKRPEELEAAAALVLPGVGHFDAGIRGLRDSGLLDGLTTLVRDRRLPVLGICLGMQLLGDGSEEGELPGLGWVPGRNRRLNPHERPVPHMGWAETAPVDETLFNELPAPARFYYVHSFHFVSADPADVAATYEYGGERVTAAIRKGNIFGTQFHPEKSHRYGLALLSAFARLAGAL